MRGASIRALSGIEVGRVITAEQLEQLSDLVAALEAQAAAGRRAQSAFATLSNLGYTDCGGALWKPPLGGPCAVASAAAEGRGADADNAAANYLSVVVRQKLAKSRAKGRDGWWTLTAGDLSSMLREHVEKGDPVDVAAFCAFLVCLGLPIVAEEHNAC